MKSIGALAQDSSLRHVPPDVIKMDRSFVVSLLRMIKREKEDWYVGKALYDYFYLKK